MAVGPRRGRGGMEMARRRLVSVTEAVGLDVVVGRLLRGEGRLAGGGGELVDLQARTLKKMT